MNKSHFAILLLLFAFIIVVVANRKTNAQVKVHVNAPPAASMHLESLWHIQLFNLGGKREIRLYGTARIHTGRLVASGLSKPLTITTGRLL